MPAPLAGVPAGRRILLPLLALAVAAGACSYTVPLTPASNVARSTFIYDSDGILLTTLHAEEDREPVDLDEVADVLVNAVIAVEDERFFAHNGVDVRATMRALFRNIEGGEVVQGGSTLTQQYVKNVLIGRERTVGRKIKEASLAYHMERNFTKETILERYLNTVYFGNGAYGAEAAAKRFFGKKARHLNLHEAALLAGMIRAPERYDPFERPDVAEARRQLVLRRMHGLGMITSDQMEAAQERKPRVRRPDERYPAGHYVEAVKRFILSSDRFGETRQERRDLLFKGGLRIHTNIDMDMQRAAEQAVKDVLAEEPGVVGAMVAIEPQTGRVRAVWGGYDFFGSDEKAKYDYATQGRRQAGSAFKPFALVTALQEGIGPDQVYPAPGRITLDIGRGQEWKVSNYGGGGYGSLSLESATVRSTNTVYAQLVLDVGPEKVVATAREMGIRSELAPYPAAVLGTNDVSPLDMASAYGTLAADGVHMPPRFIDKITNFDGNVIYRTPEGRRRVLSEVVARTATKILKGVITGGTAVSARLADGRDAAGKTGTAQEWRDASFVGYTPDLVAAVWVGHPDGQISMKPPLTQRRVTGGSYPAAIWKQFMDTALADVPPSSFPPAPTFKATKEIKTRVRVPCAPARDPDPEVLDEEATSQPAVSVGGARPISVVRPNEHNGTTTTQATTTTTAPPTTTTTEPPPPTTTTQPPTTTTEAKKKKATTTTEAPAPDEETTTTTTVPPPPTTQPCYKVLERDERVVEITDDEDDG